MRRHADVGTIGRRDPEADTRGAMPTVAHFTPVTCVGVRVDGFKLR